MLWQVRRGLISGRAALDASSAFTPAQISPDAWWEANGSTLFQSNAGSTSATANSDPVGWLGDLSGNSKNLVSLADSTVRPNLQGVGTLPYLDYAAASSQILTFAGAIGDGWNNSGTMWCFAFRSNSNATNAYMVGVGQSGSTNTIYSLIKSHSGTATTSAALFRDDAAATPTNAPNSDTPANTNVFNGSDHVLMVIDTGSAIVTYLDGTLVTGIASYTHSGTFTLNRFGLGGLYRTTTSAFFSFRFYAGLIKNGYVPDATARANIFTYMGAKAGLSL